MSPNFDKWINRYLKNRFFYQAEDTLWLEVKYPELAFQMYLENFWEKNFQVKDEFNVSYIISNF